MKTRGRGWRRASALSGQNYENLVSDRGEWGRGERESLKGLFYLNEERRQENTLVVLSSPLLLWPKRENPHPES